MQAATECSDALKLPAVRPYFTASIFLKMSKDMQGTVSIPCFHHYIVRKNAMLQTVHTFSLTSRCQNSLLAYLYRAGPNRHQHMAPGAQGKAPA